MTNDRFAVLQWSRVCRSSLTSQLCHLLLTFAKIDLVKKSLVSWELEAGARASRASNIFLIFSAFSVQWVM